MRCSCCDAEPRLFPCHHAFCADCLATPTGRGTGGCPMPGCAPRGAVAADKAGPAEAAPDALRAQRVAALRIFCQFAVVPSPGGAGWAFDAAGCRAQVSLGRREAHEERASLLH